MLSIFWLIGSSVGIILKKKDIRLHILSFLVVDYGSLFFMGAGFYLTIPKLFDFFALGTAEQIHIVLGIYTYIQDSCFWC